MLGPDPVGLFSRDPDQRDRLCVFLAPRTAWCTRAVPLGVHKSMQVASLNGDRSAPWPEVQKGTCRVRKEAKCGLQVAGLGSYVPRAWPFPRRVPGPGGSAGIGRHERQVHCQDYLLAGKQHQGSTACGPAGRGLAEDATPGQRQLGMRWPFSAEPLRKGHPLPLPRPRIQAQHEGGEAPRFTFRRDRQWRLAKLVLSLTRETLWLGSPATPQSLGQGSPGSGPLV